MHAKPGGKLQRASHVFECLLLTQPAVTRSVEKHFHRAQQKVGQHQVSFSGVDA